MPPRRQQRFAERWIFKGVLSLSGAGWTLLLRKRVCSDGLFFIQRFALPSG